jgi:hypothetical protein
VCDGIAWRRPRPDTKRAQRENKDMAAAVRAMHKNKKPQTSKKKDKHTSLIPHVFLQFSFFLLFFCFSPPPDLFFSETPTI